MTRVSFTIASTQYPNTLDHIINQLICSRPIKLFFKEIKEEGKMVLQLLEETVVTSEKMRKDEER
jgi:hypothetical protein